ncbi:MAG: hypothetical protein VXY77_03360 [Pseudomonadota bacterium]|nr:hypothetical protein [Pseudomonadota bacterium]
MAIIVHRVFLDHDDVITMDVVCLVIQSSDDILRCSPSKCARDKKRYLHQACLYHQTSISKRFNLIPPSTPH